MKRRRAFTLVELLVVIGIIAVVIAITLPALQAARRQGQKTQCLANLHQIGLAVVMYQQENKGSYPTHTYWGNLLGKRGQVHLYENPDPAAATEYTGFPNDPGISSVRPLNKYLKAREVCRCPADGGDWFQPGTISCYEAYGTSYLVEWRHDVFGVQFVTGDPSIQQAPMKSGQRKNMVRKIVLGDWYFHANRDYAYGANAWHDKPGANRPRRVNLLFGDAHAEFFTFPLTYDHPAPNPNTYWLPPPNPNGAFW